MENKTYEVQGETLIERETSEVVKNYDKEALEADKIRIQALLDEFDK